MRYDLVNRDKLVVPAGALMNPEQPVLRSGVTLVLAESPDGEDLMPLFPEADPFNDPDFVPQAEPPPLRGVVRLRLDEVARRRGMVVSKGPFAGKTNLSAVVRGTGLAYATVNKLLRKPDDQTGISFDVLARLIEFFHCSVGDLLCYEPRSAAPDMSISDYFKRAEARASDPSGQTPIPEREETLF